MSRRAIITVLGIVIAILLFVTGYLALNIGTGEETKIRTVTIDTVGGG